MIEARRQDLYDDPIESLEEYRLRADRIEGARIALAAHALLGARDPAIEEAARHAGRGMAVVETLQAFASPVTPLHMTVPLDLLRHRGIGAAEILVRHLTPAITAVTADLTAYGRSEAAWLRAHRATLDARAAPAFLTSNLAAPMMARASRRSFDPFVQSLALPPWRQQWVLWRAARRNGVL